MRGLAAIRHYGMSDFIRLSDSPLEFFLVSGEAPRGSLDGENFVSFDPSLVGVSLINDSWQVVQDGQPIHPVLSFGPNRFAAEGALAEIRRYGFTRLVLVGGVDPDMTYFTAPALAEAPDLDLTNWSLAEGSIVRIGERIGDRLDVTVRNRSDSAAAPQSLLGIFIGQEAPNPQFGPGTLQLIGEIPIPFLEPGESVALNLEPMLLEENGGRYLAVDVLTNREEVPPTSRRRCKAPMISGNSLILASQCPLLRQAPLGSIACGSNNRTRSTNPAPIASCASKSKRIAIRNASKIIRAHSLDLTSASWTATHRHLERRLRSNTRNSRLIEPECED